MVPQPPGSVPLTPEAVPHITVLSLRDGVTAKARVGFLFCFVFDLGEVSRSTPPNSAIFSANQSKTFFLSSPALFSCSFLYLVRLPSSHLSI